MNEVRSQPSYREQSLLLRRRGSSSNPGNTTPPTPQHPAAPPPPIRSSPAQTSTPNTLSPPPLSYSTQVFVRSSSTTTMKIGGGFGTINAEQEARAGGSSTPSPRSGRLILSKRRARSQPPPPFLPRRPGRRPSALATAPASTSSRPRALSPRYRSLSSTARRPEVRGPSAGAVDEGFNNDLIGGMTGRDAGRDGVGERSAGGGARWRRLRMERSTSIDASGSQYGSQDAKAENGAMGTGPRASAGGLRSRGSLKSSRAGPRKCSNSRKSASSTTRRRETVKPHGHTPVFAAVSARASGPVARGILLRQTSVTTPGRTAAHGAVPTMIASRDRRHRHPTVVLPLARLKISAVVANQEQPAPGWESKLKQICGRTALEK